VSNLQFARAYLAALERGEAGDALRRFFTEDFQQIEYPNRLNPKGQQSDLTSMVERSLRGKAMMKSQRYEIENAVADGDSVAIEVKWTGVLANAIPGLPAEMRAHFAFFLDFRDRKIARQRNYDCFAPWDP
jgi:ketosteroid isomerase-like protein